MTLVRYTGLSPMRVSKDARYSVTADGGIKLEYHETQRVRWLLTTHKHPKLVDMVNKVKLQVNDGVPGGVFYINEYSDVLVPDGKGGACFFAGNYEDDVLEFGGSNGEPLVSPVAPPDLKPGELWPGPHVGIPYVLVAGATDIRYEKVDGRRREAVFLGDFHERDAVRGLTSRLGAVKGTSGGRIFINERAEFFAPVGYAGDWRYLYLGPLEDDVWFPAPEGFPRP